jgi:hypothetical protein
MLCNFENEPVVDALNFQCVEDGGDLALELDIDHRADHLRDLSLFVRS